MIEEANHEAEDEDDRPGGALVEEGDDDREDAGEAEDEVNDSVDEGVAGLGAVGLVDGVADVDDGAEGAAEDGADAGEDAVGFITFKAANIKTTAATVQIKSVFIEDLLIFLRLIFFCPLPRVDRCIAAGGNTFAPQPYVPFPVFPHRFAMRSHSPS